MNKITTVNLGGYPFTIDENAHDALEEYLHTIESHFSDSEGCDEILDDIEARIAELFTDFLQGKSIVTLKEYNAMVKVMGRPEDFGAEAIDHDEEEPVKARSEKKKGKYSHIKTGKRLFRDPDEKVIGGVCSGIAAYFGIADPLWVRLGFIALIFIGGISVLIYPLLWAIVPAAETAGDKLKMKGEPATVSNIAKTVEEELTELSNKISEMSKDLGSKKKVKSTSFFSPKNAISRLISFIGNIVLSIINVLKTIFKPIFSLVLGILLLALGLAWAAWIISYLSSFSFISSIGPSPWLLSTLGGFAGFLTVGIPIVSLMLLITRWFSTYRIPKKWRTTLRLSWVASFIVAATAGVMTGLSFNHDADVTKNASYIMDSNIINIKRLDSPETKSNGIVNIAGLKYSYNGLVNNEVKIEIIPGLEDELMITTHVHAHGKSPSIAQKLANNINATYKVDGNNIFIPKEFIINKGDKYRGQEIYYTLHVPIGKTVSFDESVYYKLSRKSLFKRGGIPHNFQKFQWIMTEEGLESKGWQKQYTAQRIIDAKNLNSFNLDGEMRTTVKYGKTPEIKLSGRKADLDRVEEIITENATTIVLEEWTLGDVGLEITTPDLKLLNAKNLNSLVIEGFKQDKMEVNYSGRLHSNRTIKGYMDIKDLILNVSGSNDIELIGSGENLTINILDGSRVTAEQYKAKNIDLSGNIYSRSTFYASDSFECPEHANHSIQLFGNPELLEKK